MKIKEVYLTVSKKAHYKMPKQLRKISNIGTDNVVIEFTIYQWWNEKEFPMQATIENLTNGEEKRIYLYTELIGKILRDLKIKRNKVKELDIETAESYNKFINLFKKLSKLSQKGYDIHLETYK